MKKRVFNEEAYDEMDMPSKVALSNMMETKGYELVGDIEKEEYKKYDLKFKKGDEEVTFEIEVRRPFHIIKSNYDTIHIPIRKANNQSDWYIVWNTTFTEFALIETYKIRGHAKDDNLVYLECNEGSDLNYKENFIDIPKVEWTFYKMENNVWVKEDLSNVARIDDKPDYVRAREVLKELNSKKKLAQ